MHAMPLTKAMTIPLRAVAVVLFGAAMLLATPAAFAVCADDAVAVGRLCVDKYEASVWSKPPGGADPGIQYGLQEDDYPCRDDGQDCAAIYAASIAGSMPSGGASWFQAQQACANVGKRLLTNAEWQMAVQGTPDPGPDDGVSDCNTSSGMSVAAGSRSRCKSIYGAFDMVGNFQEWVADWVPRSPSPICNGWDTASDDDMCLVGADATGGPAAITRGGNSESFQGAGPLMVSGYTSPADPFFVGFRCAR